MVSEVACPIVWLVKIFNMIRFYLISVGVVAQLARIRITKGLHLSANVVVLTLAILILKLIRHRNHFLGYLITIEVFMVITYVRMLYGYSYLSSSRVVVFLLMVVMVAGACVGISLLVVVTRIINKELELSLTRM